MSSASCSFMEAIRFSLAVGLCGREWHVRPHCSSLQHVPDGAKVLSGPLPTVPTPPHHRHTSGHVSIVHVLAPARRYNHSAAMVGGKMYIFGGAQMSASTNKHADELLALTFETNRATVVRLPSGPCRQGHTMVVWKEHLVVFGGTGLRLHLLVSHSEHPSSRTLPLPMPRPPSALAPYGTPLPFQLASSFSARHVFLPRHL